MILQYRSMTIEDYDDVYGLWGSSEGIGLSGADTRDQIERYLQRNQDFSFVAIDEGKLVGAVLCGHDGRQGYIHHLAVKESCRRKDVGLHLVERTLGELREDGIQKCHLFVFSDNHGAIMFWKIVGFTQRIELSMMSRMMED